MKFVLWMGFLGAMFLPAAAFARDADRVQLLKTPHGELRAGDLVDITWSRPPRDIDELEILLSVDGGRHYALRVSPELDARDGHWRWRVPDLNAEHASLRLRVGDAREETLGESTPEFRIVGAAQRGVSPANAPIAAERKRTSGVVAPVPDPVHEAAWWSASEGPEAVSRARGLRSEEATFARAMESNSFVSPRREVAQRGALEAPRATCLEPLTSMALPERFDAVISRNLPLRE